MIFHFSMPIKKAAFKAWRQTKKRHERNAKVKSETQFLVRQGRKLAESKKAKEAEETIKKAIKALDKAAQQGIIKKNTVARTKSRLMKRLHLAMKAK